MSELEDKLNSILSDPEEMSRITKLAASLMNSQQEDAAPEAAEPEERNERHDGAGNSDFDGGMPDLGNLGSLGSLGNLGNMGINPGMLLKMGKMFSGTQSDDKTALLNAMKPYLADKRKDKMEKAMRIAKMVKMAQLAFSEFGGDWDV